MTRLIVGVQPVREAIRVHGSRLDRVLVESGDAPHLAALSRFARDHGVTVVAAQRGELDRQAGGTRHQGVIALAPELALVPLEELVVPPGARMLALDELQDPQNFGAVLRSAVALGSGIVLWPEHASAPLSPATFRASAGAIEHATLCRVSSLVSAMAWLAERGVKTVGLDAAADVELSEIDLSGPVLLVLGSEGKGLRRSVRRACGSLGRLPMPGPIGSLNASVAAALALYEVLRQRGAAARPAAGIISSDHA